MRRQSWNSTNPAKISKLYGLFLFKQANVGAGGEVMYDQRLFNQEQGMGSGLASDDTYNLYDKALFADRGTGLFRPTAAAADDDAPPEGALACPEKTEQPFS